MALGPFYVAQKLNEANTRRGTAILMRHGETRWNREGRVMGRNPVELSENGCAQVEAAAELAGSLQLDLIVTSPLVRARQTAEIIAKKTGGLEIIEDPAIAEVSYGRWEGMTYHELIDDPHYAVYRESPVDYPTPGGETIPNVQERGVAAVHRAVQANPGRRILFVSHGDIIRTVLCYFLGLELKFFHRVRIDNAALSAIQIAGDFAEVKFMNWLPQPSRAFISPFSVAKPHPDPNTS
ncbi:MAG TPA: histidine phosphatase family protein, partial [Candidatus Binataceae bacterium]|nr:histidine phosphatase family protein [Candidatus Binataceae bacterium]